MYKFSSEQELRKQIAHIASRFGLFECDSCANPIKEFLILKKIQGKQIKLYTGRANGKYGNIYHEGLKRNIATNGRHEGIAVNLSQEEIVFDNIHHEGLPRKDWIENLYCLALDLGSDWEVTEIYF